VLYEQVRWLLGWVTGGHRQRDTPGRVDVVIA
jgi:hypothetical protein